MNTKAFTRLSATTPRPHVVLLCEHASNHIPAPLTTSTQDQDWLHTHWAWDIGVTDVIDALHKNWATPRSWLIFSRLVCDANRPTDEPTCIRKTLEGHALSFNQHLDAEEIDRRTKCYYQPYHDAIDAMIKERLQDGDDFLVLSLHSFTPDYMGEKRALEIGILYDIYHEDARFFFDAFREHNFNVQYNQPWSGVDGMIFSPHKHGTTNGVTYLRLGFRQDLIDTQTKATAFGEMLNKIISDYTAQKFR